MAQIWYQKCQDTRRGYYIQYIYITHIHTIYIHCRTISFGFYVRYGTVCSHDFRPGLADYLNNLYIYIQYNLDIQYRRLQGRNQKLILAGAFSFPLTPQLSISPFVHPNIKLKDSLL